MKKIALQEDEIPVIIPLGSSILAESAANTYTESELSIPLDVQNNQVFDLDKIEVIMDTEFVQVNQAGGSMTIAVLLQSNTSMPKANDDDVLAMYRVHFLKEDTANEGAQAMRVEKVGFDTENYANYVGRRTIYIAVEGVNLASAIGGSGRLVGSMEKLTRSNFESLVVSQVLQS